GDWFLGCNPQIFLVWPLPKNPQVGRVLLLFLKGYPPKPYSFPGIFCPAAIVYRPEPQGLNLGYRLARPYPLSQYMPNGPKGRSGLGIFLLTTMFYPITTCPNRRGASR